MTADYVVVFCYVACHINFIKHITFKKHIKIYILQIFKKAIKSRVSAVHNISKKNVLDLMCLSISNYRCYNRIMR